MHKILRYTTVESVIDLPGNRSIRLALSRDPDGAPDRLTIEGGWSAPWRPDGNRLEVFGDAIQELHAALAALIGGVRP